MPSVVRILWGWRWAVFLALTAGVGEASGQSSITSDRPGIGSGSAIVEPGVIQLESGASYAGAEGTHAYSIGEVFLRYGVGGLELELLLNSFTAVRSEDPNGFRTEGLQDAGLGVKLPLFRSPDGRANVSLQGLLAVPTGVDAFTDDEWVPAVNALADLSISERVALALNVGYRAGPGTLENGVSVSVTPGVALSGGFGLYGGWAGSFSGGEATHFGESGLTYLLNEGVQLDLNSGWSVDTADWFFGGGVAVRWGAP